MCELAIIEGLVSTSEEEKQKITAREEEILEEAEKIVEERVRGYMEWIRSSVDKEVEYEVLFNPHKPREKIVRDVLSMREPRLYTVDGAKIMNTAISRFARDNFLGARAAEVESFGDSKNVLNLRVIYSPDVSGVFSGEESLEGLSNLFGNLNF